MITRQPLVLEPLAGRLFDLSQPGFYSPYSVLEWPETLSDGRPFMSEALVSLGGTVVWNGLDDGARRRLEFYEITNFFSMNIHGERDLIAGLAARIHAPGSAAYAPYLHAFIDEENKHMYLFSTFCLRYAGKIYPTKKAHFAGAERALVEDLRFFVKVLVFEEIVDFYNAWMAADETLDPLVRAINRIHHEDELRHVAFGRDRVKRLVTELAAAASAEELAALRRYVGDYLQATLRELYNPDAYRDAGLPEPHALRRLGLADPGREALHQRATTRCRRFLESQGLLAAEAA